MHPPLPSCLEFFLFSDLLIASRRHHPVSNFAHVVNRLIKAASHPTTLSHICTRWDTEQTAVQIILLKAQQRTIQKMSALLLTMGFSSSSDGKGILLQRRRPGFDPWVSKIPWRRNGNPLQYSCLQNSMDRGAWQATVHGVAKNWTRLSD